MAEIMDVWLHAHNVLRSARHIINESLQSLNLNSAEGNLLFHLLTQGPAMRQEQLAEQLDISKPAISRALRSLEAKGYITRATDPADKRAHCINLTAQARAVRPTIEQAYNHIYTLAMRGISQDELDYFIHLFNRIAHNFADEHAEVEATHVK